MTYKTLSIEIKRVIHSIKDYGLFFGIKYSYLRIRYYYFHKGMDSFMNCVYAYLKKYLSDIISNYQDEDTNTNVEDSKNIWVCWWQGLDSMPEWCRMCYENLRNNIPYGYELHLISRDNVADYVQIPQYVYDRLNSGDLTITQFSDILREALLYYQGGLWIDSSVWAIPDFYRFIDTSLEFYSIKIGYIHRPEMIGQKISQCMWSGFFMYGKKGCLVAKFAFDSMCSYYKNHIGTIDYFIQNFIIRIGYDCVPNIRRLIDAYPINNINLYTLPDLVYSNSLFDPKVWDEMTSNTGVFKITQKRQYLDSINGEKTYYGHFKELYQKALK